MRKLLIFSILMLILFACHRDHHDRIFEMVYPNITFELPAGLSSAIPWAYAQQSVASNISFYLKDNNTDTSAIAGIDPVSARITSLDGAYDYGFVEEVSVRICDAGRNQCTPADEVFYIDDLRGRAGQKIDLLPSLRNAKRNLTQGLFRLEIVFFLRNNSPASISSRLDMTFEAVR